MNDLFEFPNAPEPKRNHSTPEEQVYRSTVVSKPSNFGKNDVDYARLSTEHHSKLRGLVEGLNNLTDIPTIKQILDEPSGLYGQHLGRRSTLGDLLKGVTSKLNSKHPKVRGRIGEDLSLKQLKAINSIIDRINDQLPPEDWIATIPVPRKN